MARYDVFQFQYFLRNFSPKHILFCYHILYVIIFKCLKSLTNAVKDVDIRFVSSYTEDLIKILIKLM